jgi:hypothetical protein
MILDPVRQSGFTMYSALSGGQVMSVDVFKGVH